MREDQDTSHKLILTTNQSDVLVLVVRATDVLTYVQYGDADMGITGEDTLLEHISQGLYQPLDLQIATCHIIDVFESAGGERRVGPRHVPSRYAARIRHCEMDGMDCGAHQSVTGTG